MYATTEGTIIKHFLRSFPHLDRKKSLTKAYTKLYLLVVEPRMQKVKVWIRVPVFTPPALDAPRVVGAGQHRFQKLLFLQDFSHSMVHTHQICICLRAKALDSQSTHHGWLLGSSHLWLGILGIFTQPPIRFWANLVQSDGGFLTFLFGRSIRNNDLLVDSGIPYSRAKLMEQ